MKRALASVASQDYPNLDVVVSDNGPVDEHVTRVVEEARRIIPSLRYVRNATDIGPIGNFAALLNNAHGEYFMWLADDDEITPNYVSELASALDADPTAAAATAHWRLMTDEALGRLVPTTTYPEPSWPARAIRFLWNADDAFFYGLHRTSTLRSGSFPGYWWPNRKVIWNWGYVFLFDEVLRGRIVSVASATNAEFINHDYTDKEHELQASLLPGRLRAVIRRLNVHWLYWRKLVRVGGMAPLPLFILVSALSLAREMGTGLLRGFRR